MSTRHLISLLTCLILFSHAISFAQSITRDTLALEFGKTEAPPFCFVPHKLIKRPQIGLALSGGGARGFAQIGVLQVLEENNIPVDMIVGLSTVFQRGDSSLSYQFQDYYDRGWK